MPAAARVGDPTAHGSPLSPGLGSLNVLDRRACRRGAPTSDIHACPLSNGPSAARRRHGSRIGSTTVLINDLPAVRQGDKIVEAGGPNAITVGLLTVMIGG